MFTWSDLWVAMLLSAVVGAAIGWTVCWAIAMHYGERTGAFRVRNEMRLRPPRVAMTLLPPGVKAALLEPKLAEPEEAKEILETWRDHMVVNGGV